MNELVFSASLDPVDSLSPDRARLCGRQFSLERRMNRLDRRDRLAQPRSAKTSGSALYFGKLRHGSLPAWTMWSARWRLLTLPRLRQRPFERITESVTVRLERIEHVNTGKLPHIIGAQCYHRESARNVLIVDRLVFGKLFRADFLPHLPGVAKDAEGLRALGRGFGQLRFEILDLGARAL